MRRAEAQGLTWSGTKFDLQGHADAKRNTRRSLLLEFVTAGWMKAKDDDARIRRAYGEILQLFAYMMALWNTRERGEQLSQHRHNFTDLGSFRLCGLCSIGIQTFCVVHMY